MHTNLCVFNPLYQLPDLVFQLGVLYHMIESRVKMFHKLTKLHGKLYLLMTQVRLSSCSKIVNLSQMYYLIASAIPITLHTDGSRN